jgi:hypothetical protein
MVVAAEEKVVNLQEGQGYSPKGYERWKEVYRTDKGRLGKL